MRGVGKEEAVVFLINEARRETGTRTRMKRTERACRVLELDDDEVAGVMVYLDYWESAGEPYPKYREPVRA